MPKPEIELTEAEWTVIKAVWDKEPCTAPDIQENLEKQTAWTYSTVRTLMDRMVAKGLLKADKQRSPTIYRSAVSRAQAQQGELLYALKHAFNGALSPMVQCLLDTKNVSAEELDRIKEIIAEHEKRSGSKGSKS
jgi:BlaI family penicillinase repressor